MQAIKLTIPGAFWDSHIYSRSLYLFGLSRDITILDWKDALSNLAIDDDLRTVTEFAFLNSDLLYAPATREIFKDSAMRGILLQKFARLANLELTFSIDYAGHRQDNPFPFPHTDAEIYYDQVYASTKSGIYSSVRKSLQSISPETDKHWDAPVFDLSASFAYTTIAIAAGGEGLFELQVDPRNGKSDKHAEPRLVTANHCTACDWAFYSIYGSSHVQPAFLAAFSKEQESVNGGIKKNVRKFEKVILSDQLFQGTGFSWGGDDKLYQYHDGIIEVVRYNPPDKKRHEHQFMPLDQVFLDPWKGDVVSAGVTPFGIVIECDNALVVVQSDGDIVTILGEPVNWRVFPRSKHYKNQLHILYDDRLEIWSFNHDYFIDQKSKLAGMEMS